MPQLPIFEKKNSILDSVKNHDVTIIAAETGSGKSTQVPQYLYEAGYDVIITEPRRIACVSLANRVAEEINDSEIVSYHTGFESNKTQKTKILYCTDGIQMAKAKMQKTNSNSVLIIDEIHEWNLNIETLIAWTKLQLSRNENLKVVLMSATMETNSLKAYFDEVCSTNVVEIPNKNFEVTWHAISFKSDLIKEAIEAVRNNKNVLFFQPGKKEINETINELNVMLKINNLNAAVFPMHGEMDIADQKLAFAHYPMPKIVVATNIAQTSITIDDIDTVIDTGIEKLVSVVNGIEGLYMNNISKADCKQRAGRAGRTKKGEYYLLSQIEFDERPDYAVPEIQRLILDRVVLKLISMGLDPEELDFFHMPPKEAIITAKKSLRMMNAVNRYGDITETGKTMIKMPVNCRCARMLVEANKLHVVDDILTIIAIIESGSMLNFKQEIQTVDFFGGDTMRPVKYSDFTKETESDLLAELDIYNMVENHEITNLKTAGINSKNFFRAKALREKLVYSIADTIDEYSSTGNTTNITKALFSGMIENLCRADMGWYNSAITINNDQLKISNTSCVRTSSFVFGFPITIQYEGKFGEKRQIKILQFITNVDTSTMLEYIRPTMITEEYIKDGMSFNPVENAFYVTKRKMFYKLQIDVYQTVIHETDDDFDTLKEMWNSIPDELKRETHVQVGPFYKKIQGLFEKYVDLTEEELQQIPEDIDHIHANNKFVTFYCDHIHSVSLKKLREQVYEKAKNDKLKEFTDALPNKTGKLETIITWFSKLGEIHLQTLNDEIVLYTGLARDKGSIFINVFETNQEADESTKECLEFLLIREVNQHYQDKKFKIRTDDGRKIETKASLKAKNEFHENVKMVAEEISPKTFLDDLEYLSEVFKEIKENLENKP